MKKIVSMILAALIAVTGLAQAPAFAEETKSGASVAATSTEVVPGEEFTVTAALPAVSVMGCDANLRVNFDKAVFEIIDVSCETPETTADISHTTADDANKVGFVNIIVNSLTGENDIDFSKGEVKLLITAKAKVGTQGTYRFAVDDKMTAIDRFNEETYEIRGILDHSQKAEVVITVHAHSLRKVARVSSTCMKTGSIEHYICDICGKLFADEKGEKELSESDIIIGTRDFHHYGDPVIENRIEPTTTTTGSYESVVYCQDCGKELSRELVMLPVVPKSGWEKEDGYWYLYKDGERATGWEKVGGKWYLMGQDGRMLTGWQKVSGTWYYLSSSGAMTTGWQKVNGTWYYMNASGAMQTGWQKINNKWYYLDASGAMLTGWRTINGKMYCLKPSGEMAEKEWYGGWWLSSGGAWVYQYKGSWTQDERGWHFEDESGWFPKNETVKINDKYYEFDADGYWIE